MESVSEGFWASLAQFEIPSDPNYHSNVLLDLVVETPSQFGQATFAGLEANTSMFGASTRSSEKGFHANK